MKAFSALFVWSALIVILSVMPVSDSQTTFFKHEDKLAHILMYCIQCMLMLLCLKRYQNKKYFYSILFTVVFGIVMEYVQGFLNFGRHFDYFDIIANISGSFIGSLLFYLLPKKHL